MRKPHYLIIALLVIVISSCSHKSKEEKFWDWFSKQQNELYHFEKNRDKLFTEFGDELTKIDTNLTFEIGPIGKNQIRSIDISADGMRQSFPSVTKLVNMAPKFEKWKINAFRQRIPGDEIEITYDDSIKIAYDDIYFLYIEGKSKIDLQLHIRNYKDSPSFNNATYILLDGLIGEYDMETKIGGIERKKLDESKIDSLYKIVELRKVVDKMQTP